MAQWLIFLLPSQNCVLLSLGNKSFFSKIIPRRNAVLLPSSKWNYQTQTYTHPCKGVCAAQTHFRSGPENDLVPNDTRQHCSPSAQSSEPDWQAWATSSLPNSSTPFLHLQSAQLGPLKPDVWYNTLLSHSILLGETSVLRQTRPPHWQILVSPQPCNMTQTKAILIISVDAKFDIATIFGDGDLASADAQTL